MFCYVCRLMNVNASLRQVQLDYDPVAGKAQLSFHHPKSGATSTIDIAFSLNAATVPHAHSSHEDEVLEDESMDSFVIEAFTRLWPIAALCAFTIALAGVAWVASEAVKATKKLQQKKRN